MLPACSSWLPCSDWLRLSNEVCSDCVAETWLICASWLTICEESIGLVGSWLRICCVSRLRKSAWLRVLSLLALAALAALEPMPPIPMSLMPHSSSVGMPCARALRVRASLAAVQRFLHQLARRVHHLDIVLIRTRGRNHVDQLVDRVDVA